MAKAFPQGNRSPIIPIRDEPQNIEQGMSNGEVYEPFFEIKLHALRHSAVPCSIFYGSKLFGTDHGPWFLSFDHYHFGFVWDFDIRGVDALHGMKRFKLGLNEDFLP